jgi:outer membrane protein assembly factor BamB
MPRFVYALAAAVTLAAGSAHADQVLTYHNGNTRHGMYRVPGLTLSAAATLTLDTGFNGTISGNVYAQPLFWQPKGAAAGELIVTTQNNIVYALNATTGAVIWQRQLPAPISSGLPCGDINPEGITGTPVIDASTGKLYLNSQTDEAGAPQHEIYAISLATGAIVAGWPLNVQSLLKGAGVAFTPPQQGARSALLFFSGALYATYGGRSGDCTPYHGTIVQIDPVSRTLAGHWQTSAVGGGIWSQGGIASDGKYLFATTGNTFNANNVWGGGEAILRFLPGLAAPAAPADYYAPANWQALDNGDADLGGTEALPLTVDKANSGYAPRLIALGKNGDAYLVNRLSLGGIGGPAAITQVSNQSIITGPAVYNTPAATMLAFTSTSGVACSGENVQVLDLQSSGSTPITVKWCAALNGRGAPIFTTTNGTADPIVWVLGAEGDNRLHGYNALTGAVVYTGSTALTGLHRFQTLIEADGKFYVGADNKVYAFTFTR